MREHVLLLHGLAENSLWMSSMASALRWRGYQASIIDYPSTKYPIEYLTKHYLYPAVQSLSDVPVLHFATHSLGSILLRYYLEQYEVPNIGRIVMMSPGNKGSRMFDLYKRLPIVTSFLGPTCVQSSTDEDCFACKLPENISADTGVIAGYACLDPVAALLMPFPHDGRVEVEKTKFKGMKDHIIVPATHDSIMFDPIAISQAIYFLRHGRFNRSIQARKEMAQTLGNELDGNGCENQTHKAHDDVNTGRG